MARLVVQYPGDTSGAHRARVALALGLKEEARQDADRARQLAPDDAETKALEAALAEAGA